MNWIKRDAGDYESHDGRFHIFKGWDRTHGDHWLLYDRDNKRELTFDTFKQCKQVAEKNK